MMSRSNSLALLVVLCLVAGACGGGSSFAGGGNTGQESQVVNPVNGGSGGVNEGRQGQNAEEGSSFFERTADEASAAQDGADGDEASDQEEGETGSEDAGATPTTESDAPVSTDAPPTTETPSTTEAPSTTKPPTTKPPTTTEPPTTTSPPTTAAPVTSVKVTMIRFQAIKDCDGIEGAGDWNFWAYLRMSDGTEVLSPRVSGQTLSDGEFVNQVQEASFTLPATNGQRFDIEFVSEEVDQDILGNVYADSRMEKKSKLSSHIFDGTTWSNLTRTSTGLGGAYPAAIQVTVGSGDCSAEFHYVVDVS